MREAVVAWAVAAVAVLPGSVSTADRASPPARPNIIFVYTDDQAPTAVGISGNPQVSTPNMDRLFGEGARLVNAFVTTPVCSPARAGLMTSRYGTELGITDWINPGKETELGLEADLVTWPEVLASAGYTCGLVGKWHLGTADRFHPTRHGYHFFMGFRAGGARPVDPHLEVDGAVRQFTGYTADILTDHALRFLDDNRKGPFVLSLHFRAPHAAWLPVRPEDLAPYRDLDPALPDPDYPGLDVARVKRMTGEYYASVSSVDRNLGRLLDRVDALGLRHSTAIIFTSDHGYNLGHGGLWYKGNAHWMLKKLPERKWSDIPPLRRPNLFDQSLRVPAAIRWPGRIAPGSVVREVVTNLDWYPTLLAIAGVDPPGDVVLRGKNFLPLLLGTTIPWENEFYAEYSMKHGATTHMRGWRTPRWKLMIDFHSPGRGEFYDLRQDPRETTNLLDSKKPEIAAASTALERKLRLRMRAIGDEVLAPGR